MKKLVYLLFALLILSNNQSNAQNNKNNKNNPSSSSSASSGGGCFNESSKILNIGIGFGGRSYYNYSRATGYSYRSSPALSVSYEQALKKKVGPGFLGIGGYFGYQSAYLKYDDYYYNNNKYYYRHNWKYMMFAVRGAYHLDALNFEKGEIYFGGIIGLRYTSYSYETNSTDPNKNYYQLSNSSLWPAWSFFGGGRYYLAKNIAVYGELGYGISYLTVGASFKF